MVVGEQMAKANSFDKRFPGSRYRDDSRWEILFAPGFSPDQKSPGFDQLDERAAYTWEAVWTTAGMVTKTPGVGQAYLGEHRDKNGRALDCGPRYRLHVPPIPPAGQCWFVTIYDLETRRPVENATAAVESRGGRPNEHRRRVGQFLLRVDAENGHETNSLATMPGRAWFPLVRLYGPLQPYFDRSWKLPDIETLK